MVWLHGGRLVFGDAHRPSGEHREVAAAFPRNSITSSVRQHLALPELSTLIGTMHQVHEMPLDTQSLRDQALVPY